MKLSTQAELVNMIAWPFETLIAWAIWNWVIAVVFALPLIAYWQMLLILVFVGLLFPSTHSFYLGKIADAMHRDCQ